MGRRAFLAMLLFPALLKARPPMPVGDPIRPPKPVGPPLKFSSGPAYDPDHRCDKCGHESAPGTGTWVQTRDAAGRHEHTCPNCGNAWWHFDDGHVLESVPLTLPPSGCAGGNCPTSSPRTVTRWRLFR